MSGVRVSLKLATSLDGRIALADGTSQWITNSDSRARTHQMRAEHDAVLVGVGTVLADDPLLTARTVPMPKTQPVRIVADSNLKTPLASRLIQTAQTGRVVLASAIESSDKYAGTGVELWRCGTATRVDCKALLDRAEVEALKSIFLEGGGTLAASFIRANLVDQIFWFRAPIMIGAEGLPALGGLGLSNLGDATRWKPIATERIGDDVLDTYVRF